MKMKMIIKKTTQIRQIDPFAHKYSKYKTRLGKIMSVLSNSLQHLRLKSLNSFMTEAVIV